MLGRLLLLLALATPAIAAPRPAGGKPPGRPAPAATVKDLPPWLGLFGPRELLSRTGFRSSAGRWAEFQLDKGQGTLRLQEVAGAPAGRRWLELIVRQGGKESSALRLQAPAESGVLEQLVARMPGLPAMELPLESLAADPSSAGARLFATGAPQKLGAETLVTPAGRFACDHFSVKGKDGRYDFWITADAAVPFNGTVKLGSPTGTALLLKTGTDATPQLGATPAAAPRR